MSIKKDAVIFAKEMIEHGYLGQMSPDEIVDKSCDMAHKIHEKTKKYKSDSDDEKLYTKRDLEKAVLKSIEKKTPIPIQEHINHQPQH